jgi:hypothetical protein
VREKEPIAADEAEQRHREAVHECLAAVAARKDAA